MMQSLALSVGSVCSAWWPYIYTEFPPKLLIASWEKCLTQTAQRSSMRAFPWLAFLFVALDVCSGIAFRFDMRFFQQFSSRKRCVISISRGHRAGLLFFIRLLAICNIRWEIFRQLSHLLIFFRKKKDFANQANKTIPRSPLLLRQELKKKAKTPKTKSTLRV